MKVQRLCQCHTATMLLLSGATTAIALCPATFEMMEKRASRATRRLSGSLMHVALLESFYDFQCISGGAPLEPSLLET